MDVQGKRGKKATCGGAQPCHLTTVCLWQKWPFKTAELLPSWETTGSRAFAAVAVEPTRKCKMKAFLKNKIKEKCVHRSSTELHREI